MDRDHEVLRLQNEFAAATVECTTAMNEQYLALISKDADLTRFDQRIAVAQDIRIHIPRRVKAKVNLPSRCRPHGCDSDCLGQTKPTYPVGQVLNTAYPIADLSQVRVMVGGQPATALFAGVTFAGVFQVNIEVPAGITTGDLPVTLRPPSPSITKHSATRLYRPWGAGVPIPHALRKYDTAASVPIPESFWNGWRTACSNNSRFWDVLPPESVDQLHRNSQSARGGILPMHGGCSKTA
jgi:hypothetical protein